MANRRFIDFPIAASVGNNDIVLIWQDGLNKQTTKATLLQGSPQSLAGLTDVDIAGLINGQILQYNSTTSKWENVDRTDINLSQLGDVTIVAPANGQVLVYNSSTGKWENSSAGYVPYTGAVTTVNLGAQSILAGSFVKAGGTAAQFLKANGSVDSTAYGTGTVTSVALTMPTAFSVAGSPITTTGTLAVTGAGTVGQYIRGDGSLADFPATTGGGSSVSYYLNGSVSQGTIGGVAYKELNRTPIFGAGTDISINANGYIASFITDALDPNKLLIPAGNWNFETYFSANSNGGSPSFYIELYKYNGTTFTLLATSSAAPELIAFGTSLNPYYSTLAVPETVLALTDRLAVRFYVTHSGRTITLHTENGHLCQVITTFTTGLTALNGLTPQVQFFAVGTSGTDFAISSASDTHTFNLPTASGTNRGALSSADWTTFNNKENAITAGTTAQYFRGDKTFQTLNTSVVPELTNLYYTEARVNANTNVAANTAARHNAVTLGTANGLSLSTQVLSLGLASAGVTGALSGTDWTTFNGKQNALTNPVTGTGTTNYLAKFTGTSTIGNSNLINDSIGNLGLGVTPSAWTLFSGVLELNGGPAIGGFANLTYFLQNANFDSGFKYKTTNSAGRYELGGQHSWWIAPSGTAGNAITFTQAMTLTSGGNLLVGTTTDGGARFQVSGNATINGDLGLGVTTPLSGGGAAKWLTLEGSSTYSGGTIYSVSSSAKFYHYLDNDGLFAHQGQSSVGQKFITNNSERMRITSGGNLQLTGDPFVYSNTTAGGTVIHAGLRFNSTNKSIRFFTNDVTAVDITSGQNMLIGNPASDNGTRLQVNGSATIIGNTYTEGLYIATGQITQGASATNTFYSFSNTSINRVFLITLRQSGGVANNVIAMAYTFGANANAYNIIQDNTNPVLFLTISNSGLNLTLTTGAGYGITTWDWTVTQIR